MEENIKILEEMITWDCLLPNRRQTEAIENLIKEYKKLKEDFEIVDHECSRLEKEDIRKDLEINALQKELDKYKEMYTVSIADRVNSAFKQEHKNKEDLEMLYKGCQIELEKKDKIIDEMAKTIYDYASLEVAINCPAEFEGRYNMDLCKMNAKDRNCLICIKEYFKKKVETEEK